MIKLFTLDDISAFSSDTVYKIGLAAEPFGLRDENIISFPSREALCDEVLIAAQNGDYVIVAAECKEYNSFKRSLIARLLLEEHESEEIKDLITLHAGEDIAEIDLTGHSLVPCGAVYHFTSDGLYCGFTADVLHGKLTCLPLDFMRIDAALGSLIEDVLEPLDAISKGERPPIRMPDADIQPHIEEMVESLGNANLRLALATGEATMWVYNLYDSIEGLTDKISFVEVIDEDEPEEEATAETESVRIIRHAREAMTNSSSDIGAAVSEIYSTENDEGKTVYFAYVSIVDKGTAKAKKITTTNPEDLSIILPHALGVLSGLVKAKAEKSLEALAEMKKMWESDEEAPKSMPTSTLEKDKPLSKNMLIAAICGLVVAVILPIILVVGLVSRPEPEEPTLPPVSSTMAPSTPTPPPPSNNIFDANTNQGGVANAGVTEPVAPDVTVVETSAASSSTSGDFTFYVFGFGHGVGMSQTGANYLAGLGWSWADILAHYYYDAEGKTYIVTGEVYPEKITYEGKQYETREYLARALEAEMPASSNLEALKAQVVALYTFARYYNAEAVADRSPIFKAKLTKSSHAFLAEGKTPSPNTYAAVDAIIAIGPYIENNGTTALTPYHAMSAGKTTSYYNCWGKNSGTSVTYLNGARTSIGDYYDQNFKSTVTISSSELRALASEQGIELSGDPATWLSIISHDAAVREDIGYVSSIKVGNKVMTGNDFRIKLLGGRIRSHCFAITYTPTA